MYPKLASLGYTVTHPIFELVHEAVICEVCYAEGRSLRERVRGLLFGKGG